MAWASRTGVVQGYDGNVFKPLDNITREQLAVMLFRYAKLTDIGTVGFGNELGDFDDGGEVHAWAEEAMVWCVVNGIITGKTTKILAPTATATRAEAAAMLLRMVELMK